jgi:DNA invertase Pin-like site-specific DNA recombinase
VGYIRVSTAKQSASGLGLDAQKAAIAAHAASSGCVVLETYEEVESGRKSDSRAARPRNRAREARKGESRHCETGPACAQRRVYCASDERRRRFRSLRYTERNRMTLHIVAAIAEGDALAISDRTKAGLAALKARGFWSAKKGRYVTLGMPNITVEHAREGRAVGVETLKRNRSEAYEHVAPIIAELRIEGLSFGAIANRLNDCGEETRRGKPWNPVQVRRVLVSSTLVPASPGKLKPWGDKPSKWDDAA